MKRVPTAKRRSNSLLKLIPRAANAFHLEVMNYNGEVAYTLEIHSDGSRLQILCREKKFTVKETDVKKFDEVVLVVATHSIIIDEPKEA